MNTVVCMKKNTSMAFGTAYLDVRSCSAIYQLYDLGMLRDLSGFSYLKCKMELIIASDQRVDVRIQCVNTCEA